MTKDKEEFYRNLARYRMFSVSRVPVKEGDPGNRQKIKITDTRRRNSITINVSSDLDFYHAAAMHLEDIGIFIHGFGMGWDENPQATHCVLLSQNFDTFLTHSFKSHA